MQTGFVARTQRGRTCTKLAYEHLNIPMNDDYAYNLLTWKRKTMKEMTSEQHCSALTKEYFLCSS